MKRTPGEIFAALVKAGFDAASATTMTAISLAESGGDDAALGDVNLQTGAWGPSYGLFQIRTRKDATGTGDVRDISNLARSDDAQAYAAYKISGGGQDFSPWSVYTSGAYQQYLGQAQAASGTSVSTAGLGSLTGSATAGVRNLLLDGLVLALGLGLVVLGVTRTVAPRLRAKTAEARGIAKAIL